jgi:sugar/nucleoside kinase (ribokinase family)
MLSLHAQVVLNTAPAAAAAERLPAEILAICDIVMPNQIELAMLTDMPTGAVWRCRIRFLTSWLCTAFTLLCQVQ